MNVFVARAAKWLLDAQVDMADAVVFAESFANSRVGDPRDLSEPTRRMINLALAFLSLRYPLQCCGQKGKTWDANGNRIEDRCVDCPMRGYDEPAA